MFYVADNVSECIIKFNVNSESGKTSVRSGSIALSTPRSEHPAPTVNQVSGKPVKPVLIMRYLGTTPDSSALTPMLISLCQQVIMLRQKLCSLLTHFALDIVQLHDSVRRHS